MFLKPDCTIAGPNDAVKKPKTSQKLDWECELAIVIGKEGTNIARKRRDESCRGLDAGQ